METGLELCYESRKKKKEGLLVEGKMRKGKAQRPKITWRFMDLQFLPCG